jgi:hypothetical protein
MKTEINPITGGANMARRSFLRYAGASAAAVAVMGAAASCSKNDPIFITPGGGVDIGSDDPGILNYAYALEQLEAAFYMQVIATPYSGMNSVETSYLTDIRDHEVVHRDFFKAALGSKAIASLTPDFSKIDFSSRDKVLGAAKAFEDLGVQAYEARHAALISNLISPGTFVGADQVDSNGLNKSASIAEVLAQANTYLKTKVSAVNYNYKP